MNNPATIDFPSDQTRERIDQSLMSLLRQAHQRIDSGQVTPSIDMDAFRSQLLDYGFDQSHDFEELLSWSVASMEQGLVQMTHPGYFGLFNPAPTYPAECADRIVAALNPQICVWSHAPVAVEIEKFVIQQFCQRLGFTENSDGHFTSGGSEANHTSVVCALTNAHADFDAIGSRVFTGQPRLYVSAESHLAWLKIAHQTGIGREAVCLIDTDGYGRMDALALDRAIQTDLAKGAVPFYIGATAGTTNAGQVDPLRKCAELASAHKLWFHVDAAWGGALIADKDLCQALAGIDLADSVTIDAHKWFATTMGAGMYLTQQPKILRRVFRVTASYMPSHDAQADYYLNSMQWSRRFIGLRLFLSLASSGWAGQAQRMLRGIELIERLKNGAIERGWRIASASKMAMVCLSPPTGIDVTKVIDDIVRRGEVWVSHAKFEDQSVLRACITNGKTSEKQIDLLVQSLPKA